MKGSWAEIRIWRDPSPIKSWEKQTSFWKLNSVLSIKLEQNSKKQKLNIKTPSSHDSFLSGLNSVHDFLPHDVQGTGNGNHDHDTSVLLLPSQGRAPSPAPAWSP